MGVATLKSWRSVQSKNTSVGPRNTEHSRWKKPNARLIKINLDGALDLINGGRACRWAACDHTGLFIRGGVLSSTTSWPPDFIEAL
ncbi:unnamed protein product [Cuscuta europaea]|uniref:Uncharacterized protein n=1 Tax=Cuscuta europaea TaxID=41803 RepID=A0A9P0Z1X2_CUSEU|nr:unnamed protein product [Cuscuta europaea]